MKTKLMCVLMVLLLVMAVAVGCDSASQNTDDSATDTDVEATDDAAADDTTAEGDVATGDKLTIGYSCKTITNDDFQKTMAEYAQAYVESLGHEFILTVGGDQDSIAAQVNNVEDMINMGVDAIILSPPDKNAFIPVLQKAKEAGIPVVIVDSGIEGNEDLYVTYVGTDNVASGEVAGQMMVDAIGEGEVLVVLGSSGSDASENRAAGFRKGIEGSGVVIVNEQNGDWVTDTAMTVTENMLQANPDIKGIFTCSDVMYPGIISAVEAAGLKGDVVIIGHDGFKLTVDAIAEGAMYGTVLQQPNVIGELGAQYAIEAVMGTFDDSLGKFIDAGALQMTAENLDELKDMTF